MLEVPEIAAQALLKIARENVERALRNLPVALPPLPAPLEDALNIRRATFVTLFNGDRLRGCLGHFEPRYPLKEEVAWQARETATCDSRFHSDPVKLSELPALTIEVSILSERHVIESINEIKLGEHGIIVDDGRGRRGVYLPQVATEHHMTLEQFLTSCCRHKAGLPGDAWKDLDHVQIETFTTQIATE
ncbi:MAG TPA: AmmeMemoRadiSam system protein A [Planctomycetota bacterium]|nr:AmmeMemoRadiSam system protein A [Planctomycetota bacterium]